MSKYKNLSYSILTVTDINSQIPFRDSTKNLKFSLSTATANTTMTLQFSGTSNTTLTIPDISDTIETLARTSTLTNKTLTLPTIASYTKGSGVVTIPASTAAVSTLTATETFSNKIVVAPIVDEGPIRFGTTTITDPRVVSIGARAFDGMALTGNVTISDCIVVGFENSTSSSDSQLSLLFGRGIEFRNPGGYTGIRNSNIIGTYAHGENPTLYNTGTSYGSGFFYVAIGYKANSKSGNPGTTSTLGNVLIGAYIYNPDTSIGLVSVTAVGHKVAQYNSGITDAVLVGARCFEYMHANRTIAIGCYAARTALSEFNTFIGYNVNAKSSTVANSVAIGSGATGSSNGVSIGYGSGATIAAETTERPIVIGYMAGSVLTNPNFVIGSTTPLIYRMTSTSPLTFAANVTVSTGKKITLGGSVSGAVSITSTATSATAFVLPSAAPVAVGQRFTRGGWTSNRVNYPVLSISTSTAITSSAYLVVSTNTTIITVTLPSASSVPGREFKIAARGSADVTVTRSGSDTISGNASFTLVPGQSRSIISDGVSAWIVL